jgi:hypothetical protein
MFLTNQQVYEKREREVGEGILLGDGDGLKMPSNDGAVGCNFDIFDMKGYSTVQKPNDPTI